MDDIIYLSGSDIASLDITPAVARTAVLRAFRSRAEGSAKVEPKLTVSIAPGHFFQSLCSALTDPPYAACKWVGVAATSAERGLPNVNALIAMSDLDTGRPVAVLDGNLITVLRTAAMSALAAEHLARPDSTSIGFVGCGEQAHGHLAALREVLPALSCVVAHSRSSESAARLVAAAERLGLSGRMTADPAEAVGCDVVVTSVPAGAGLVPFLHSDWLKPGSFVTAVDLGRSWRGDSFKVLDVVATDDLIQAADPENRKKLAYPGPFAADLAALVSGRKLGRTTPEQRTMFLFPGFALADLALAAEVLAAAIRLGRGTRLPR